MQRTIVVVLLVAVVAASMTAITPPTVETIQIHNDHVVYLHVGVPGKWLRFRVRADTANVYIFQHPSPYSSTWMSLPHADEYGQPRVRDTLMMGTTQLRVDFIVGRFAGESSTTVEGTQAEGVLGLAATSPLWTLWRNFTRSRDTLLLGRTLHRVSEGSTIALEASLPPSWVYASETVPSFVAEFTATISAQTQRSLEAACHAALGSVVDDAVELASEQLDALAHMLGVQSDSRLCAVPTHYRVLVVPHSDYNVIPRALMMHRINEPPVFRLADSKGHHLDTVLFNRFDDVYIEVDTTNAAGSGVSRMANQVRPGGNDTIVLGDFGLRRFEFGYALDEERIFVAQKHTGLSRTGTRSSLEHSIETRNVQDIFVIVAGLLLWALLATEPDPVYPRHRQMDTKKHMHSWQTEMPRNYTEPVVPPGAGPVASREKAASLAVPIADGVYQFGKRDAPSTQKQQQQPVGQSQMARTPHRVDTTRRDLATLASETGVRVGAVLAASFRMESEWPIQRASLLWVQCITEAVVALYFVIALGFYDVVWALSLVLWPDATRDSLGWTSVAMVAASVAIFSVVALVAAGRDARVASLALQFQVLAGIFMFMVSLYEWDLALGLLFVIVALLLIVLLMLAFTASGLVPQYHRHANQQRAFLRAAAGMMAAAWTLYFSLALFPFIVNRLWDNKEQAALISVFLTIAVAFPVALYLSVAPFVYPLMPANAAIKEIFDAAQRRRQAITGEP